MVISRIVVVVGLLVRYSVFWVVSVCVCVGVSLCGIGCLGMIRVVIVLCCV